MMLFVMIMIMVKMDSVEEPGDTVADGDEHRVPHAVVVEPDYHHRVREQRLVNHLSQLQQLQRSFVATQIYTPPPVVRGQAKVATTATAEREDDLKSRLKKYFALQFQIALIIMKEAKLNGANRFPDIHVQQLFPLGSE